MGTYKNVSGSMRCTTCPAYSTSPSASLDFEDCLCQPGFINSTAGVVTRTRQTLIDPSLTEWDWYQKVFLDPLQYTSLGVTKRTSGFCNSLDDEKMLVDVQNITTAEQCKAAAETVFHSFASYDGDESKFTWQGTLAIVGEPRGCLVMAIRDRGTCGQGIISSPQACMDSAAELGYTYGGIFGGNPYTLGLKNIDYYPSGCLLTPLGGAYFNEDSNNVQCTSTKMCLCKLQEVYWNDVAPSAACSASRNCLCLDPRPHKCYPCARGSYSAHVDHHQCTMCPDHTTSLAGSVDIDQCMCERGYYGLHENCTSCPVNTYKDWVGGEVCTPCPPHSSTLYDTSTSFYDCLCDPGFQGDDASVCAPCPRETYKDTKGTHRCLDCPANTDSVVGSIEIDACLCKPAHFTILGPGIACEPCPEYTWKNLTGSVKCLPCPANTYSPKGSLHKSNCSCISGHSGLMDGEACVPCQVGKYKVTGGPGFCDDCPYNHTTSPPGSVYAEDCRCNPGYFGDNGQACVACPIGKFKEESGTNDCDTCFPGATSPPGSVSRFNCTCVNGFRELRAGVSCADIDECILGLDDCSPFRAECINTAGSFRCECKAPYFVGNGTTCQTESSVVKIEYLAYAHISLLASPSVYKDAFAAYLAVEVSDLTLTMQKYEPPLNCSANQSAAQSACTSSTSASRRLLVTPLNSSLLVLAVHLREGRVSEVINASDDLLGLNGFLSSLSLHPMSKIFKIGELVAECGNGFIEPTEGCDDGNEIDHDGCSSVCDVEPGWTCQADLSLPRNSSLCTDINECQECDLTSVTSDWLPALCSNLTRCSEVASCINTDGSYLCVCRAGLLGDGLECVDDTSNNASIQRDTVFSQDPVQILRLSAGQAASLPNFGTEVALSGNVALFGSEGSTAALLFTRGHEGEWNEYPTHVFSVSSASSSGTEPGQLSAVALHVSPRSQFVPEVFNQDTEPASCAAVGSTSGAVYVYHKEPGMQWDEHPRAVLAGAQEDIFFGASVALSARMLLVGVPGSNMAVIFERPRRAQDGTMLPWPQAPSYRLDGHAGILMLGQKVAASEEYAAVASYLSAQVVVFRRHEDGTWPRNGSVLHPAADQAEESSFGLALSASRSYLMVGDPARRYVAVYSATNFTAAQQVLRANDGGLFAHCVSSTDLYLVVGARGSNRAFIFQAFRNKSWSQLPVAELAYEAPHAAADVGTACAMNNQDVLLPSQGHVFVHASACAPGFYGPTSDHCYPCPAGTSSENVSRTITACFCEPGTFGPGGGPCAICPRNFYCPRGSARLACPSDRTSRNGSSSLSECEDNQWLLSTISHSTSMRGADNVLQVRLKLNIELEAKDRVRFSISGLSCADEPCRACLSGLAVESDIFTDTCDGCGLINGTLVVLHEGHTTPEQEFGLSFCVTNPQQAQAAPDIFVEAAGGADVRKVLLAKPVDGSRAALGIVGFLQAEGWQSTFDQVSPNTITISMSLTAVLEVGSYVRVFNLTNSNQTSGSVPFLMPNTSRIFCEIGTWAREETAIVAPVCLAEAFPSPLVLQVTLSNKDVVNQAPQVGIAVLNASGQAYDSRLLDMQSGRLAEERIGIVAGFLHARIRQTSASPSAENTITAVLVSTVALSVPSRRALITIAGLTGSISASTSRLPVTLTRHSSTNSTAEPHSWRASARWKQGAGTIEFEVSQNVAAKDELEISWVIGNPSAGQASPPAITVETSRVRISVLEMMQGTGSARILSVAGLYDVSVGQSSPCPGATNTISVSFKLYQSIPYNVSKNVSNPSSDPSNVFSEAELVIMGLNGTESDSIASVSASGGGGSLALSVTSWDRVNGTLVVSLDTGTKMHPDTAYTLQFDVTNSLPGQDAVQVEVLGRAGATMAVATARPNANLAAPLRVYGVRAAALTQSVSTVDSNNTLTLTVSFFAPLPHVDGGVPITVSGLTGSATLVSTLPVSQTRMPVDTIMASEAQWDGVSGELVLSVSGLNTTEVASFYGSRHGDSFYEYQVSFQITNPETGQPSPALIHVSSAGGGVCTPLLMPLSVSKGRGYLSPLLVADLLAPTLSQSSASVGALNSVTLTFHAVGFLPAGTRLIITGLECMRCGSIPDQCILVFNSLRVNGTVLWDADTSTDASPFVFTDTSSLRSPYPIGTLTLGVTRDVQGASTVGLVFALQNGDCGQDPTPSIFISALPESTAAPQDYMAVPTRNVTLGAGVFQPLVVNYFADSLVTQTSVSVSGINHLTVSFSTRAPLARGSGLILSGNFLRPIFLHTLLSSCSCSAVAVLHLHVLAHVKLSCFEILMHVVWSVLTVSCRASVARQRHPVWQHQHPER